MNRKFFHLSILIVIPSLFSLSIQTHAAPLAGVTTRVSLASDGTQGDYDSGYYSSISANGRYVAFESGASNLVSGDTNYNWDVFVQDRQSGLTTRVSVASDGVQGNGGAVYSSISADGRYVAFHSWATNLVSGDTDGWDDVFVHDRQSGQTERVSVASDGTQGNDNSYDPSISAGGRYVAFMSDASNLVNGDTNGWGDVFVHDREGNVPVLTIDYPTGQPGSYFTITGQYIPPNATASVYVNEVLVGTTATDGTGNLSFQVHTYAQAQAGAYIVKVTVNPQAASVMYQLDPAAPLRPQGSAPVIEVPGTIAPAILLYLPVVFK